MQQQKYIFILLMLFVAGTGEAQSSREGLIKSLQRRIQRASRVAPEVRLRVVDRVEKSHHAKAGRGFKAHLLAITEIKAKNKSRPILSRLKLRLRQKTPGLFKKSSKKSAPIAGPKRAAARSERIEELITRQRKLAALAKHGPEVLENVLYGGSKEDRRAVVVHGTKASSSGSSGGDGSGHPGRTRVHLHKEGSSALGRRTVVHGARGLPTIVVLPNSKLVTAIRRKVATELGRYTPGVEGPNGKHIFWEKKRGILWELPILLQRYVKLRDRAPEGKKYSEWLASTKYGAFTNKKARAGEQVTLDDYLRMGEVGEREMALLMQIMLQDMGFNAQYIEGNLGVYSGKKVSTWYRRSYINAIRIQQGKDEAHEWVQVNACTDPSIMRTFNGCEVGKKFMDVRNFPAWDYIFSFDKNVRMTHATGPKSQWWKRARPFRPGEEQPAANFAEYRPPPRRPMPKWSFTTSAEHETHQHRQDHERERIINQMFGKWQREQQARNNAHKRAQQTPRRERINHFRTLGLPQTASEADIKRAYRRLAMRHHSDHAGKSFDKDRWVAIQEAYEALLPKK